MPALVEFRFLYAACHTNISIINKLLHCWMFTINVENILEVVLDSVSFFGNMGKK